jgi:membrane protein
MKAWHRPFRFLQRVKPPFFGGLSVWDIGVFFFRALISGAVTSRAASVAFSFFMALFPGIIFVFTLIPFLPIEGFQPALFELMREILPPTSFEATRTTINDILTVQRGDLLGITVLAALIFATNGTLALIANFTQSVYDIGHRNFWSQYLAAFILTAVLSFLLISGIAFLVTTEGLLVALFEKQRLGTEWQLLIAWRYAILIGLILLSVSLVFKYGPASKAPWRLISPGAVLATFLVVLSSAVFGFYVSHFARYNQLYGSIGTLLIIQLWIYINAIGLIVGYELDASVAHARSEHAQSGLKTSQESSPKR